MVDFIPKIFVSEIVTLQTINYLLFLTRYLNGRIISISSTLECELITFIKTEAEERKPI